jgi:hypothetical protein
VGQGQKGGDRRCFTGAVEQGLPSAFRTPNPAVNNVSPVRLQPCNPRSSPR